jgi:hypothetical protein
MQRSVGAPYEALGVYPAVRAAAGATRVTITHADLEATICRL